MIDLETAKEAAILTGIGLGTAFGLLVFLMVTIVVVRQLFVQIFDRLVGDRSQSLATVGAGSRDKALAAAIGVTAVFSSQGRTQNPAGDR